MIDPKPLRLTKIVSLSAKEHLCFSVLKVASAKREFARFVAIHVLCLSFSLNINTCLSSSHCDIIIYDPGIRDQTCCTPAKSHVLPDLATFVAVRLAALRNVQVIRKSLASPFAHCSRGVPLANRATMHSQDIVPIGTLGLTKLKMGTILGSGVPALSRTSQALPPFEGRRIAFAVFETTGEALIFGAQPVLID